MNSQALSFTCIMGATGAGVFCEGLHDSGPLHDCRVLGILET